MVRSRIDLGVGRVWLEMIGPTAHRMPKTPHQLMVVSERPNDLLEA